VHSVEEVRRHPERLAAFSPRLKASADSSKSFSTRIFTTAHALGREEDAERITGDSSPLDGRTSDLPRNYREKAAQEPLRA